MTYTLYFTVEAKKDLARLKKNEPAAFKKVKVLLKELQQHPGTGTGKPKPLGYGYKGFFSRRITKKHRLVYSINDEKITVLVVAASGHYSDK
ncbi:Txe/YoeB family addiction module toxin [Mariniphaga sediminis]|jgi:toxin YoeB|uniref:Putative mRNA interferase YoeB n=1 Tax=Mariniphaga sediminis TaxID=1628158 RepID=A0A399D2E9_9BACT|nr:Txe/YoeB family addiction module toxin [Mariniphaga sediminis]RIH64862.1 Txe/YoeB family addiction module toxin [Mariniphaga sediminis]